MRGDLARLGLELGLLLAGYFVVDRAVRLNAGARALTALGLSRPAGQSITWTLLGACTAPLVPWSRLPEGETLGTLGATLALTLAWRAATRDVDVVEGEVHGTSRALVTACALGSWLSPTLLLSAGLVLTRPFEIWEHHATLPMRCVQALLAFAGLSLLAAPHGFLQSPEAVALLLVVIQVSHYVITALAKGYLGPRWYSWPLDNSLHHIAASAYSWGWARFVPWSRWMRVIAAVRRVERPLQVSVFALELTSPLALLDARAAIAYGLAFAGFHVGVFALSGLLFWEWVVTDLALALALLALPAPTLQAAFGPGPLLLGLLVLVVFPLRHRLWKPMPLGWWDTPFTQRMHWRVRGESGALYGLYADFMDPHERIYGKVHACFLAPVPVLTYHLGEAWRHELRDGLRQISARPFHLESLREQFGVRPQSAAMRAEHLAYLARFAWALNRGAHKHVLPRALRWLKAPGGQCYYWGELPAYRAQERATSIEIVYREELFDGRALRRLHEEIVARIDVPHPREDPPVAREPTPKQLDDLLLSVAAGRLIRLPGLGGGFVGGDDGAAKPATAE